MPRRTLRELIDRHGVNLCSDARRCEGLLRDLCGSHQREINILMGALRDRVPLDLLAAQNSVPRDLLLTRLAKRLEDRLALTQEAARWAVDTWALALGIVSDAELEEGKTRRVAEAAAPRREAPPTPSAPPPHVKDEAQRSSPPAISSTRLPATPPRAPQNPPPPPQSPPPPPVQARQPPPPAQARQPPTPPRHQSPPASRPLVVPPPLTTSSPLQQTTRAGRLQTPAPDPPAQGGRSRWRGCLIGCLLLVLLSVLLSVGGSYVLDVLRQEQEQRSLESPPVRTR